MLDATCVVYIVSHSTEQRLALAKGGERQLADSPIILLLLVGDHARFG